MNLKKGDWKWIDLLSPQTVMVSSIGMQIIVHTLFLIMLRLGFDWYAQWTCYWNEIIFGIWGIVACIFSMAKNKNKHSVMNWFAVLFMSVCFISFTKCRDGRSFRLLLMQILYCGVFLRVGDFTGSELKNSLIGLVRFMVAVYFCFTLFGMVMYFANGRILLPFGKSLEFAGNFMIRSGVVRYVGFYEHAVIAGIHCAFVMIMQVWLYANKKASALFTIMNCCLHGWMLYMSDSRTGMVLLVITAAVYLLCAYTKYVNWIRILSVLTVSFILCVTILCSLKIIGVQNGWFISLYNKLNSISSYRLEIWRVALETSLKTPLFGAGWANISSIFEVYKVEHAHCSMVSVFLYTGVCGLLSFIGLSFVSLKGCVKNLAVLKRNKDLILFALLIGLYIASWTDNLLVADSLYMETSFYWVLVGYCVYCGCGVNAHQKEES